MQKMTFVGVVLCALGLMVSSRVEACINTSNFDEGEHGWSECGINATQQNVRKHVPQLYVERSAHDLKTFWSALDYSTRSDIGCADVDRLLSIANEKKKPYVPLLEKQHTPNDGTAKRHLAIDRSAQLLRAGNAKDALPMLLDIESAYPGHYETATNLGTAYELLGDNEKALQWIARGIELNPQSHQGSEWLHVLILQAKIQAGEDATWFERNSIMGLPFLKEGMNAAAVQLPKNNLGQPASVDEVLEDIRSQMIERIPLVPTNDPVVANILYDAAYLSTIYGEPKNGMLLMKASGERGHPNAAASHFKLHILYAKEYIRDTLNGDIIQQIVIYGSFLSLPICMLLFYLTLHKENTIPKTVKIYWGLKFLMSIIFSLTMLIQFILVIILLVNYNTGGWIAGLFFIMIYVLMLAISFYMMILIKRTTISEKTSTAKILMFLGFFILVLTGFNPRILDDEDIVMMIVLAFVCFWTTGVFLLSINLYKRPKLAIPKM